MGSRPQSLPSFLQLPDACLLAVLQCCTDDPCTLFSAARAHSRLHQAAVLAASSIRAVVHGRNTVVQQQHKADSVLLYLGKHGQHVGSIRLPATCHCKNTASLHELPDCLSRLECLQASSLCL
jgi:hypothetical protein